ncbi:MAG: DMT family transporter [Sediminibacterium sp.]
MRKALLQLHASVFLAGFTGILGVLIELNEGLLVWYRMAITVVTLLALLVIGKKWQNLPFSQVKKLFGIGMLIALHWVFFYGSIKMANVSIGLVCVAGAGLFTALLEPLFLKVKIKWPEVALGLLSLLGILLIFKFDARYRLGIGLGIVSAILASIFSVLNKKEVDKQPAQMMMVYELTGGLFLLTLLMPFYLNYFNVAKVLPSLSDIGWLLILSWLCTVLAMDLILQALKKVSAFTQNLTLNLEPVYGILLAFIVYQENKQLGTSFYLGISCIVLSVVFQIARASRS